MVTPYQFQCDYIAGCTPQIMDALLHHNLTEVPGYCEDMFCKEAEAKIREACKSPDAGVFFFAGGTICNLSLISAVLRPWQGVLAAPSGHIAAHETGAIEATGHKVLEIDAVDGKLTAEAVRKALVPYRTNAERIFYVEPGLVYISNPTELGTLYSLAELKELSKVCREEGLFLYVDGARLAYALAAGDIKLEDYALLTDAFCIGGTKCGALGCEALVITDQKLARDFLSAQRQRGALLSKGRLAGLSFSTFFTDDLYGKIGKRAIEQAMMLKAAFVRAGIELYIDSPTNQQFVLLNDAAIEHLRGKFIWEDCGKHSDDRTIARFCTAWSTTDEALQALLDALGEMASEANV